MSDRRMLAAWRFFHKIFSKHNTNNLNFIQMIYSLNKNEMSCGYENPAPCIEQDFVNEVCELVIEALNVNHNERRLIKPLLVKSIGEKINNRWKEPGLLQQFESYVLDISIARLLNEFNLTSKVNHEHATHAKLADIVIELSKNEKPNDTLVKRIITEVGVPLPKYDYEKSKFTIELPINIPSKGGGVTGSIDIKEFDSFSEALNYILSWKALQ